LASALSRGRKNGSLPGRERSTLQHETQNASRSMASIGYLWTSPSPTVSLLPREIDYTEDLKKIDVPTLVIHGDDDQIVPIGHAGERTARIVPNAQLKVYEGAPHGLASTHQDKLNADLLAFARR
jgi:pimeloyl-ACP methyl ester carboxylesterase